MRRLVKIGLHASMLQSRYALPECLEHASALGADSLELDIGLAPSGEAWSQRRATWVDRVPLAAAAARSLDLRLPSLCLGALWQYSLASEQDAIRATGIQVVRDGLAWADMLGATAVLIPVGQPPGVENEAARRNLITSLSACLPDARRLGITLALENLGQPFLWTSRDFLELLDAVDSPICGVYFDIGNHLVTDEDPAEALRRLGRRVVRVHLKDTIARPRVVRMPEWTIGMFDAWARRTTVTLGTGDVHWPAIRSAITQIGYRNDLIIEVPQPAAEVDSGCLANLAAARQLFPSTVA